MTAKKWPRASMCSPRTQFNIGIISQCAAPMSFNVLQSYFDSRDVKTGFFPKPVIGLQKPFFPGNQKELPMRPRLLARSCGEQIEHQTPLCTAATVGL